MTSLTASEGSRGGYQSDKPGTLYLASWPGFPVDVNGTQFGLEKVGITNESAKARRLAVWSSAGATEIRSWDFEDGSIPDALESTVLAYWGLLRDGIDHPPIPTAACPVPSSEGITETHLFAEYLDEFDHATTNTFIEMLLDSSITISTLLDTMPLTDCWDRDDLMMEEGTDWGILASWVVASRRRLGFATLEEALEVASRPEMEHRAQYVEPGDESEGLSAADPFFETVKLVQRGSEWRVLIEGNAENSAGWRVID